MEQAQASLRDGDDLCPIMDRIARAPAGHEEEHVYRALFGTELMANIPTTFIDLGHPSLGQFPVFTPANIIETLAARGKVDQILGVPLGSCPWARATCPNKHTSLQSLYEVIHAKHIFI